VTRKKMKDESEDPRVDNPVSVGREVRLDTSCPSCKDQIVIFVDVAEPQSLICPYCESKIADATPVFGYVYGLTNGAMPDLLKIGFTTRPIRERVSELGKSTAAPLPFEVAFWFSSEDPRSDESRIHSALESSRVNEDREFLSISCKEALETIREVLGSKESFLAPEQMHLEKLPRVARQERPRGMSEEEKYTKASRDKRRAQARVREAEERNYTKKG
jgi:hypothetical protein